MNGWSAARRAKNLGERRPALLNQLPHEIAGARDLTHHRREEALDEAILFTAFDHRGPVLDQASLDRVLWAACSLRVNDALRGRRDTVRGRFTAADQSLLGQFVSEEPDPALVAEQRYELETLLEFARSLDPLERAVMFVRHQRPGEKVHGYATMRVSSASRSRRFAPRCGRSSTSSACTRSWSPSGRR